MRAPAGLGGRMRLLWVGPFVSMFDRFSMGPLLVPIAHDFRVPLSAVAIVASIYFLLYGAMQIVYGLLSDRIGRVRLMRLTLVGFAASGFISAAAPNLGVLLVGRALTGALICALIPSSLVYVGDSFPFRVRQQAIADLLAAVAVGTATATLGAGLLAHYLSWRLAFLLPALIALGLSYALRWLPESLRHAGGGPLEQLGRVVRRPWAVFLVLFGLLEGAVMLGLITYLAPALEARGVNAAVAGLVASGYGVAVLGATQAVKRLAGVPPPLLVVAGGLALTACFGVAALRQDVVGILVASGLAGVAYGAMHSTFQTWATEIVPEARGTTTAAFASSIFLGAGLGTAATAPLAGSHQFGALFALAALLTLPMFVVGAVARARYGSGAGSGPGPGPGVGVTLEVAGPGPG